MAVRTNVDDVKAIMDGGTSTASDPTILSLITAASAILDQVFLNDVTIGTTLLTEMERWLTAHMLASSTDRTAAEEEVGDARLKYTGKWGEKLSSTPYGQMVLTLDTTGKMAKIGKQTIKIVAIKSFD